MTEAMPFLQKHDITFLRPPTIRSGGPFSLLTIRPPSAILKGKEGVEVQDPEQKKPPLPPERRFPLDKINSVGIMKIEHPSER